MGDWLADIREQVEDRLDARRWLREAVLVTNELDGEIAALEWVLRLVAVTQELANDEGAA